MFIRDIQLVVGNLLFPADGGDTGYRISFEVSKTMLGAPNEGSITIYNLKNDKIDQLQERGLPVELSVGWKDEEVVRIFKGDLQTSLTTRSGTDRQTVLKCLDGGQAITYAAGQKTFDVVPVSTIVEYLAGEVLGLDIAVIDVNGETGFKGRVISGSANKELDDLAREFGFSWSVQDDEFYAIDDESDLPDTWEISRSTGLTTARQILSGPLQVKTGVEILAILNPRIFPNHRIDLKWKEGSDFPKNLADIYKVHNITFVGDSHSSDWHMNLQCFTLGGF
jgi:hypothetical protein